MVFLYVTCKDDSEGEKIADAILNTCAAGCVNILPTKSVWRNEKTDLVEKSSEVILVVKTQDSKVQAVERIVRSVGSYTIPCIASFTVSRINTEYKEWLGKVVA